MARLLVAPPPPATALTRKARVTPRTVALTLGVAYALLTALELVGGWAVGGTDILLRTTKANLLHWAVALVLLGSRFSGIKASGIATRVVGVILVGLGVWGYLGPAGLGDVLGYPRGIPAS